MPQIYHAEIDGEPYVQVALVDDEETQLAIADGLNRKGRHTITFPDRVHGVTRCRVLVKESDMNDAEDTR